MRAGCILPLLTIGLLIGGGQGLFTALNNREPKVFAIDRYLSAHPKPPEKWIRLTGGTISVATASYQSTFGVGPIDEIFVPVHAPTELRGAKVRVLMATNDPVMLASLEKTRHLPETEALRYAVEHRDELFLKRDVEGLIRFGIDLKDKDERKLRALNPDLADDFVILDEGKKPEILPSMVALVFGIILAAWYLGRAFAKASPPALPPLNPPPIPGRPRSARSRGCQFAPAKELHLRRRRVLSGRHAWLAYSSCPGVALPPALPWLAVASPAAGG